MKDKVLSRLGLEVWKDVPGFENYKVSNLGNVKSLKNGKEKILKQTINTVGYYLIGLYSNGKRTQMTANQLVAIAFLNHKPCGHKIVVDHIDTNKLNNKLCNLQLITHRENLSKDKKGTSKYTGVFLPKGQKKWRSEIRINGKKKHLGCFVSEKEASEAYKNALKKIQ